jgi:hypothetical protein
MMNSRNPEDLKSLRGFFLSLKEKKMKEVVSQSSAWTVYSRKGILLAALFIGFHGTSFVRADETAETTSTATEKTYLEKVKEKVRMRTFTEFMTPAFKAKNSQVPTPEGDELMPTNTFNIAWVDYEVAQNWRVLYWQRFFVNFASSGTAQGINTRVRNPRFALRRTQVFDDPNLNTTYDLYIQPGLAQEGNTGPNGKGRTIEGGFRTNTAYTIPKSRWSVGAITEFTLSKDRNDSIYGWVLPWISYEINSKIQTQHYVTVNFLHTRGESLSQWGWDLPMPYIQNGFGFNVSKSIWAAAFLNNYLNTAPSLKNTWASVWLAFTVL